MNMSGKTKEELDKIDILVEEAVASSAIEGYITTKKNKERLRQWLVNDVPAD